MVVISDIYADLSTDSAMTKGCFNSMSIWFDHEMHVILSEKVCVTCKMLMVPSYIFKYLHIYCPNIISKNKSEKECEIHHRK